ncbi:MAG: M1 family aminopeptidase, partial [Planctomycetota bacterium]
LVGVLTIAAALLTSLIVLAFQGNVPITIWPFLLVWCLILLPTFLLWSTFVSFLYSLVRNRYTTYALALGAFMWTSYKNETGGLSWVWNWPLWGVLQWSDMGVFELVRGELVYNRLLALTATLFFTVLTVRLFPRRQIDATNLLLRLRPLPLLKSTLKLSPVIIPPIVLALMLGSRIDAGFQGDQREKAGKDYWRKNVATWTDSDIPDLVGVELDLELFPERRSFEARGTYRLLNEHDHDLAVIPITRGAGWRRPDSLADSPPDSTPDEDVSQAPLWFLNGEPFEPEDAAGLMLFRLPQPLTPGAELTIGFHHSGEVPAGATENGGGTSEFILPSGVVLTSFRPTIVPGVGYNDSIGVDEDNRYDAKEFPEDHYEGVTRSLFGGSFAPYHVSMRVTAPEEYRINGVGVLRSDEVADGKRTVLWETDSPVRFFNVVAGRWTEARGQEGTVIYHHPEHTYNIPGMLEALDGARKYYSEWFFPYPWQELKISEFPALAGYAQGFPTNITFSEGIGFLTKEGEEDAAAPFMVTAHESAHQWWGNILTPGEGPGGNLLSEGMAHFSTLLLFELVRGLKSRIAFAKMIEDQYGDRRQKDSERPLVKIDGSRPGDTTVTYDKAGWVFWMLLNHMGRKNCLSGIQSFIAHYEGDRDHPLLEDYIAHLRPFAPDAEAYDAFVQQWFLEVVVPKYELEDVQKAGDPESGWTVTMTIENTGTGVMPVEVALSAGERFPDEDDESPESGADPDSRAEAVPGPGEVLAAEIVDAPETGYQEVRTTVTLGPNESAQLVIECSFEPERVVVDPDALVLMLGRKYATLEL